MVGIIVVSENQEAQEMLKTARRLLGRTRAVTSIVLKSGQTMAQMRRALQKSIHKVDNKKGVLLLTDFYGSTQCNICMEFVKKGSVELLTGFNLPMLVKLVMLHETMPFKKLIPYIADYGRTHICHIDSKSPNLAYR